MKKAIVVLIGALSLVACSKERQPAETVGTTAPRGATERVQPTATVEEVRAVLLEKRPESADTINALAITNDGGIITLRGKVEDEPTRSDLVNRVRAMPNVRGVRDELRLHEKPAAGRHEHGGRPGTTTTTGGTMEQHPHEKGGMSKSDAVRKSMEKALPKAEHVIHGLTITDDGQVVTISGTVPDEATHHSLLKAAKDTPGVKSVKDDLKVEAPKK
jgi:osmotically-inducible protein OsmY